MDNDEKSDGLTFKENLIIVNISFLLSCLFWFNIDRQISLACLLGLMISDFTIAIYIFIIKK